MICHSKTIPPTTLLLPAYGENKKQHQLALSILRELIYRPKRLQKCLSAIVEEKKWA